MVKAKKPQTNSESQGGKTMKNSISKCMMIAAAAVALSTAVQIKAAPAGSSSGPTPVVEQEVPAKRAMSVVYACSSGTVGTCTTAASVPAGMRLVIESINASVTKINNPAPVTLSINTFLDGVWSGTQYFFPTSTIPNGTGLESRFNINTKFYTDSIPALGLTPSSDYIYVVMNGYLVKK
jgi:hypothetical protein